MTVTQKMERQQARTAAAVAKYLHACVIPTAKAAATVAEKAGRRVLSVSERQQYVRATCVR